MTLWIQPLLGGILIGIAAVLLMLTRGRILGVSGILSQLLPPVAGDWLWRILFIAGVLISPALYTLFSGIQPEIVLNDSVPLLIISGLLVGIGTVVGSGCTSGHGVCGLPRLSPRSIVATLVFILTAAVVVFITRHVL